LQDWALVFPEEFWLELARLEGVRYTARSRPLRWGKYIMLFVYDAIDGDAGKELRKKNPEPRFLRNHHQWLKKFGRDKVHDQIERVITIMKLCNDMTTFGKNSRESSKRVRPNCRSLISTFRNERSRQLRRPQVNSIFERIRRKTISPVKGRIL
jgi:hypothetical protein